MPTKANIEAIAQVLHSDCRPTVEVSVPAGTPFNQIAVNQNLLVDIVRKLGPRGCETCLSGRDILIRERYEEVINVALPARG